MMIRKRAASVTAVFAAAALLSGCAGAADAGSSSTLTISGNSSEKAGLDSVVADFEAANPGVTVTTTYSADPQSTLPTQLSAGTAADVLWLNSGQQGPASVGGAATDGYLLDVADEAWAKSQPKIPSARSTGRCGAPRS